MQARTFRSIEPFDAGVTFLREHVRAFQRASCEGERSGSAYGSILLIHRLSHVGAQLLGDFGVVRLSLIREWG